MGEVKISKRNILSVDFLYYKLFSSLLPVVIEIPLLKNMQ